MKVVIIGAGPGGYVAALRAAQMDAEVTLVEKEEVGGTCLHWGCIPTKVMKYAAEIMESIRGAAQWGIQISETTPTDLLDLQKKKGQVVDIQTKGILQLLKRYGIRLEYGYGIIEGSNRVAVRKKDGKALELSWDRL
ncbi:MAG: dihydrolipoyl dehydrogenase, partial [Deltaproteobacteria bacterium]